MAFDFKKLTQDVTKKADSVAKSVQKQMPDAVKNIDMRGIAEKADAVAKSVQEQLPESMKNIDVKSSVMNMAKNGSEALAKFTKQEAKTDKDADAVLEPQFTGELISYKDAMRVIYYLMAVDHAVSPEEVEKFDEIGKQMDPMFSDYRQELVDTCTMELAKAYDDEDYYDVVHDLVGNTIKNTEIRQNNGIDKGTLYWNLLAISYSDADYSESEKRLLRYISRLFNIDKATTMDMENSLKTLIQIGKEEDFLKESGRSYGEVQKHMEELQKRREAITQGVYALITD